MGTLVGLIAEPLVSSDAFDPNVVNLMRNQWQCRVSFELKAVADSQFVCGRHQEVEQFEKSVVGPQIEGTKWIQKVDFTTKPRGIWCWTLCDEGGTPLANGDLGGDVTLTGSSCQLDRATIAR
uniref:Uncharacterized protein n=1 Tax=Romanomermis culicivorax TaxID=13658 RepID=A0A915KIP4_ROMCU